MNIKKILFYVIWISLLCLGPLVVFKASNLHFVLADKARIANFVQRILGLTGFTLIFFQVVLGSLMDFWTERLGGWIFRFHIFEGVLAYSVIFLHPLSFLAYYYFIGHGFDPYFIYVNACVICPTSLDYFYTLGRIAFWLLTITVLAGLLRMEPFLRNNWRKLHIFNYVVFFIVAAHGFLIGTDLSTSLYRFFFFPAVLVVLYITLFRRLPILFQYINNWLITQGYKK